MTQPLPTAGFGSSPRMRGAHGVDKSPVSDRRIIPAYAGSTIQLGVLVVSIGDHPRVCGEHWQTVGCSYPGGGSSPRMRGAQDDLGLNAIADRIIPAYAGSTRVSTVGEFCKWDHPRVCGEHGRSVVALFSHAGSSPRMRGALYVRQARSIHIQDHPRVCGEHAPRLVERG